MLLLLVPSAGCRWAQFVVSSVDYEQHLLCGEVRRASQKKISGKKIDVSALRETLGAIEHL